MSKPLTIGGLLLLTTALVAPAALAQPVEAPAPEAAPQTDGAADQEKVDMSIPGGGGGGDIVVTGRFIPEPIRATPEVVAVLSTAEIARTGEGDIAGALQRVTGLSVVGNGFVYVRGLGDRYSAALLNGSPLPSPEPLKRVVPLDIFPTSVLSSALVQKSYSVNYPGEFGGGLINLTTKAVPNKPFLEIGGSISGDTETTGQLGYTYYGSDSDWTGFDDGTRDVPAGIKNAIASGKPINAGNYSQSELQGFAASLVNAPTTLLQRNHNIPANFSFDLSGGTAWDVGDGRLGLVASASYSNSWRTRNVLQQSSLDPNLEGMPQSEFQTVITDNRVLLNGLVGLGYEFGDGQAIRWTNLYIRDVVKQGRLAAGYDRNVTDPVEGEPASLIQQNTYWFERQLINSQAVGEFKFGDVSLDLRGSYANSKRKSPYERGFSYAYNAQAGDYVNNLAANGQNADIAFSDLNEDVYGGSADLTYELPTAMKAKVSAGYAYTKTERTSSRYQYQYFRPDGALPLAVAQERPDYLVSDYNIYTYNIQLRDVSSAEGAAAYEAGLEINAGYAQAEAELLQGLNAVVGVRYEDAKETVLPLGDGLVQTSLKNDYFLPAATVTWNFAEDMQLRVAASKTIARPQFRELAEQIYQDFESDRQFTGNPRLTDSKLTNAEARYEYYFGRGERLTVAGFWKKIDNPIETVAFFAGGGALRTGFANAPEAQLYGAEVDIQKYFPLDTVFGDSDFWATRRLMVQGNYTYTKSKLKVDDELIYGPQQNLLPANVLFEDGAPLTGQSDHIANLQIGFEDMDRLSQQTILVTYASKRVTNRGPIQGEARQPDIVEKPGLRVDFVAREEVDFMGAPVEIKFEARNLTGTKYQEYQQAGSNRIYLNRYDLGTSVSLGASVKF
ncbi:TonB-dependent receptor [Sphingomonas laterariae]|uniref:TonB-dependent receptor n=1 Tax=Edaphosphingomonas laterariae TaxID=861865 RepID=A0A239BMT3_9SPHN|nr:TonB-dependent receptor [Sphingomonas laterariae]SNS09290.1 TonB-dependent receptor [Sphingomonas laterariae]